MPQHSSNPKRSLWDRILIFLGLKRNIPEPGPAKPSITDLEPARLPFYSLNSKQRVVKIDSISLLPGISPVDPSFIKLTSINSSGIYFLTDQTVPTGLLDGKYARLFQAVIPASTRMVDTTILREIVNSKADEAKCININTPGLLSTDEIEEGVLVNICGRVTNKHYSEMKFHPCDNKRHSFAFDKSTAGFGTCPDPVFAPDDDDSDVLNQGSIQSLKQKLVVFHIPYSELIKPQGEGEGEGEGEKKKKNLSTQEILIKYFTDAHYPGEKNPNPPIAEGFQLKQGVFLIPMAMPNDSVAYYCILNIDGDSNRDQSVKKTFQNWFYELDKYNQDPENKWIGIAGNDATFCYIDNWSVFVGKNAQLLTEDIKKVYKDSVLASVVE